MERVKSLQSVIRVPSMSRHRIRRSVMRRGKRNTSHQSVHRAFATCYGPATDWRVYPGQRRMVLVVACERRSRSCDPRIQRNASSGICELFTGAKTKLATARGRGRSLRVLVKWRRRNTPTPRRSSSHLALSLSSSFSSSSWTSRYMRTWAKAGRISSESNPTSAT